MWNNPPSKYVFALWNVMEDMNLAKFLDKTYFADNSCNTMTI